MIHFYQGRMDWKVSGEFSFRSKLLLCIYAPSTQSAMHNFFPEHQYIVLSTSNDDLAYIEGVCYEFSYVACRMRDQRPQNLVGPKAFSTSLRSYSCWIGQGAVSHRSIPSLQARQRKRYWTFAFFNEISSPMAKKSHLLSQAPSSSARARQHERCCLQWLLIA